jgi:hypothetical protein
MRGNVMCSVIAAQLPWRYPSIVLILRGSVMRILKAVIVATSLSGFGLPAFAADTKTDGAVPQLVHCGIKDGQPKEYGTKEAAEADGATNIVPKTGDKCPALE